MPDEFDLLSRKPAPHPGEVLHDEYMKPLGLSVDDVAEACDVLPLHIRGLIDGNWPFHPEMALRLGHVLDTGTDLWTTLQTRYDVEMARTRIGADLAALKVLVRRTPA